LADFHLPVKVHQGQYKEKMPSPSIV
jgi:hypothetical protein